MDYKKWTFPDYNAIRKRAEGVLPNTFYYRVASFSAPQFISIFSEIFRLQLSFYQFR